jgi:hypothetical protein
MAQQEFFLFEHCLLTILKQMEHANNKLKGKNQQKNKSIKIHTITPQQECKYAVNGEVTHKVDIYTAISI